MNYSKESTQNKIKKEKSKGKKNKNKVSTIIKTLILAIILILIFGIAGTLIGAYLGILENAPAIDSLSLEPDIYSTIIYSDTTNEEIDRLNASENREYVTLDQIPLHTQQAFIAIEDERFYEHNGIDPKGIIRAGWVTLTTDSTQGASTITQQLIKNALGYQSNNIVTKIQEQYLAVKLEKDMTEQYGSKKAAKDKILELYLNTINLGNNLNGVQTASQYYFAKDVSELTIAESACIAAITQWPSKYNPVNHPEENEVRKNLVLEKMLELEFITQEEYDEAMAEDVYAKISEVNEITQSESTTNSYYVDQVITEVTEDLMEEFGYTREIASNTLYNSGLQIYIPQDLELQQIVDDEYLDESNFAGLEYKIQVTYVISIQNAEGQTNHYERSEIVQSEDEIQPFIDSVQAELVGEGDTILAENVYPVVQPQSAFTLMENGTGKVLAITGGRGEKLTSRSLNRATESLRQPGSTFKVLASYAPGIDMNVMTAGTVYVDEPYEADGHQFNNWYSGYRGPVTVRTAIEDSMNIIAVKALDDTGIENAFDYLLDFGFTSLVEGEEYNGQYVTDKTHSLALGGLTWGVSNLELTAAYQTIANGGVYVEPTFYTKVLDHDGNVILDKTTPESHRVLEETTAYIVTDIMEGVVTRGTGTAANFNYNGIPVAGKTGTTSDTKDLTFVGYTPYFTAGVWLGHDTPETINGSGSVQKRIWSDIMYNAHAAKGFAYKDFTRPDGLVNVTINSKTGLIPSYDNDPYAYSEIFKTGTEPTEVGSYVEEGVPVPEESVQEVNGIYFYIDAETGAAVYVVPNEEGGYVIAPDDYVPEPIVSEEPDDTDEDTEEGAELGFDEDGNPIFIEPSEENTDPNSSEPVTTEENEYDEAVSVPIEETEEVIEEPIIEETEESTEEPIIEEPEEPIIVPSEEVETEPTPEPTPIVVPEYDENEVDVPIIE